MLSTALLVLSSSFQRLSLGHLHVASKEHFEMKYVGSSKISHGTSDWTSKVSGKIKLFSILVDTLCISIPWESFIKTSKPAQHTKRICLLTIICFRWIEFCSLVCPPSLLFFPPSPPIFLSSNF